MTRKAKFIIIALLVAGGICVIGQILSSIGWCTGFFPDSTSNCSAAPFFQEPFEILHRLYAFVIVFTIFILIPLAIVVIPIRLIRKAIRHFRKPKV